MGHCKDRLTNRAGLYLWGFHLGSIYDVYYDNLFYLLRHLLLLIRRISKSYSELHHKVTIKHYITFLWVNFALGLDSGFALSQRFHLSSYVISLSKVTSFLYLLIKVRRTSTWGPLYTSVNSWGAHFSVYFILPIWCKGCGDGDFWRKSNVKPWR